MGSRPRQPGHSGVTPGVDQPRFPGLDVLAQSPHWDPATRVVVLGRLETPAAPTFLTPDELATARTLCDVLLDQQDEPRVPVAEMIDARLAQGSTDGWRYADLPEDGAAWQRILAALDEDACDAYDAGLTELSLDDARSVVAALQHASRPWHGMPTEHVWSLVTRYACTAFYSHPWAWNEIGFSGPAYPRGYKNIGVGRREPWEVPDHRDSDPVAFDRSGPGAGS
jgi:hypothetical protein